MTNITNNRISQELNDTIIQKINDAINVIQDNLPFLIGLTKVERRTLPKINRQNKLFVDDTLKVMKNNQHLVPPYISFQEINRDFTLYKQLDEIGLKLAQLAEKTSDTQMLAGSEAYSAALMFYKMAQLAAQAGVAGADTVYDTLKERFKGQGPSSSTTSNNNASTEITEETTE